MSLVAWIPPAALAERALGPDIGGDVPSLIVETERPYGPQESDWRWTGEWTIVSEFEPAQDGHTALLLSLDGAPCALSIWRGRALLDAGEPLFGERSPRDLAEILVARLGGEIVEVTT